MAPQQTSERWHEICALAAEEQDPEQLQTLTREINRLLRDKEQRLRQLPRHLGFHLDEANIQSLE